MLLNGLPLPYVQRHPPEHPEKRDVSAVLKQAFEGKQRAQQELGLKRIQAEQEVRLEITSLVGTRKLLRLRRRQSWKLHGFTQVIIAV